MRLFFKILLAAAMLIPPPALHAQGISSGHALTAVSRSAAFDVPTPDILLKSNMVLLGMGITNVSGEFKLNRLLTVDVPFVYSPYTWNRNWNLRILAIQPELRYWLLRTFEGHFFGLHAHTGFFNVATDSKTRYQDRNGNTPVWGFGISYGYSMRLCYRFGMELTLGAGYAHIPYDAFYNVPNGAKYDTAIRNYWGITRLGISLYYSFNRR